MSIEVLIRVPFIVCTAAALFYSRVLVVSVGALALLAWLGFWHPPHNSTGDELLAFGVSAVLGLLVTVAMWAFLLQHQQWQAQRLRQRKRRHSTSTALPPPLLIRREPFIRDIDIVLSRTQQLQQQARDATSIDTMRWLAQTSLGVLYTLLLYLCTEAMRYQRSNVHRWSSLASVALLSFVAYVYDRHVSDAYSFNGVYRLLDARDAHMHFYFLALSAAPMLVDIVVHQTAAQNACTAALLAVYVLSRMRRIVQQWFCADDDDDADADADDSNAQPEDDDAGAQSLSSSRQTAIKEH